MFEFDRDLPDRELLTQFVFAVKRLLMRIVRERFLEGSDHPDGAWLRVHPDALEDAQAALKEFIEQGHLETFIDAVRRAEDGAFRAHGLTGAQLRFKLTAVRLRETRFLSFPWIWTLRRFIEAIDTLLDSLIEAVGAGGALKELKDSLYNVADAEDPMS